MDMSRMGTGEDSLDNWFLMTICCFEKCSGSLQHRLGFSTSHALLPWLRAERGRCMLLDALVYGANFVFR